MKKLLLALIAIFFISSLSGNCRCDQPCLRPAQGPCFNYDFSKPFNEKRYWIEQNSRTGAWQICWQRLGLNPEFFETTNIFCFAAQPTDVRPDGVSKNSRCWRGDGIILCQHETGRITVYHLKK